MFGALQERGSAEQFPLLVRRFPVVIQDSEESFQLRGIGRCVKLFQGPDF